MVFPPVLCPALGKNIGLPAASQTGACDAQHSTASGIFRPLCQKNPRECLPLSLKFNLAETHFSKFVFRHAFLCLRIFRINWKRGLSWDLSVLVFMAWSGFLRLKFSPNNAHIYIFGHN